MCREHLRCHYQPLLWIIFRYAPIRESLPHHIYSRCTHTYFSVVKTIYTIDVYYFIYPEQWKLLWIVIESRKMHFGSLLRNQKEKNGCSGKVLWANVLYFCVFLSFHSCSMKKRNFIEKRNGNGDAIKGCNIG